MNAIRVLDKTALLVSWLIAGGIGVSHAELVEIKWANGAFVHKAMVAPKKFLEVCGKLKKDENVSWSYKGNASTDFNIHYHVGKEVAYPENRKETASAEGMLRVPLDQDFCWMWSNKTTQAVEIEVNLQLVKSAK